MWQIEYQGTRSEVYVVNGNWKDGYDFVARFKYGSPKSAAKHFVKFLTKNFTPAEYKAARAAGKTPLAILEAKGYVAYNKLKALEFKRMLEKARQDRRTWEAAGELPLVDVCEEERRLAKTYRVEDRIERKRGN